MKGHDGLCPTPNPHIKDRDNCAYCNLIEVVKDYYRQKGKGSKTYEEGYHDGWKAAIDKLKELS
jgi:hypothetical protein